MFSRLFELFQKKLFLSFKNINFKSTTFSGKYSFQYIENATVEDSILNTKDAFWHAKNIHIKNSTVNGEYLGWYSEDLTFINCKISGTQPLCYCKNLTLINCTMDGCDLSFEYSSVNAKINGFLHSVKNVKKGKVVADKIGEIINENSKVMLNAEIYSLNK